MLNISPAFRCIVALNARTSLRITLETFLRCQINIARSPNDDTGCATSEMIANGIQINDPRIKYFNIVTLNVRHKRKKRYNRFLTRIFLKDLREKFGGMVVWRDGGNECPCVRVSQVDQAQ